MDEPDTNIVAAGAVTNVAEKLKGIRFPAAKRDVLEHARREGADESVLETLEALPEERRYENPVDLFDAVGDEIRKLEG